MHSVSLRFCYVNQGTRWYAFHFHAQKLRTWNSYHFERISEKSSSSKGLTCEKNLLCGTSQLEDIRKRIGSSAHMITTARVPADKAIRIAFSLNDSPDDPPRENAFPLAFPDLEQQLQPLPPCHDSKESMQVYKQHCQIAEEYYEVKKEIALLEERKKELILRLDQVEKESMDAAQLTKEYAELTEENRTLKLAQTQCVEQLEKLRIQYQKRLGSS